MPSLQRISYPLRDEMHLSRDSLRVDSVVRKKQGGVRMNFCEPLWVFVYMDASSSLLTVGGQAPPRDGVGDLRGYRLNLFVDEVKWLMQQQRILARNSRPLPATSSVMSAWSA